MSTTSPCCVVYVISNISCVYWKLKVNMAYSIHTYIKVTFQRGSGSSLYIQVCNFLIWNYRMDFITHYLKLALWSA